VLLRVTNKHAGRRLRYAQATTRSKTTQHSIHDSDHWHRAVQGCPVSDGDIGTATFLRSVTCHCI